MVSERSLAWVVSSIAATGLALGCTALIVMLEDPLVHLFTNVPEVRAEAHRFYLWAAFLPLAGVMAYQFDGIFVGATEAAAMRNAMIVSAAIYFTLSGWAAAEWGNHGVWAGITGFLVLRGLTLFVQYPGLERRVAV